MIEKRSRVKFASYLVIKQCNFAVSCPLFHLNIFIITFANLLSFYFFNIRIKSCTISVNEYRVEEK